MCFTLLFRGCLKGFSKPGNMCHLVQESSAEMRAHLSLQGATEEAEMRWCSFAILAFRFGYCLNGQETPMVCPRLKDTLGTGGSGLSMSGSVEQLKQVQCKAAVTRVSRIASIKPHLQGL